MFTVCLITTFSHSRMLSQVMTETKRILMCWSPRAKLGILLMGRCEWGQILDPIYQPKITRTPKRTEHSIKNEVKQLKRWRDNSCVHPSIHLSSHVYADLSRSFKRGAIHFCSGKPQIGTCCLPLRYKIKAFCYFSGTKTKYCKTSYSLIQRNSRPFGYAIMSSKKVLAKILLPEKIRQKFPTPQKV